MLKDKTHDKPSHHHHEPREAPKAVQSKMETVIFSSDEVVKWVLPPFQRPLRINEKVRAMAEELKSNGGFIVGVITLGHLKDDKTIYLVDGQHRVEGFKMSGLKEVIADIRHCKFDSMADMAEEFVRLNSRLVNMRPDDLLRGLEGSIPALAHIRHHCKFVGYDEIRRAGSQSGPILGMAQAVRCWKISRKESPSLSVGGAVLIASELTMEEAITLCRFLNVAHIAWDRDRAYAVVWSTLNLSLCMWLYRRIVLDQDRSVKRAVVMDDDLFGVCLTSLTASQPYIDYLRGRNLSSFHRTACFDRIRKLFSDRVMTETNKKARFPQPDWYAI